MTKYSYQIWIYDGGWMEQSYSLAVYDTIADARLAAKDAMLLLSTTKELQWTVQNDQGVRVDAGVKGGGVAAADSPAGGITPVTSPPVDVGTGTFNVGTLATGLVMIGVTAAVIFVGYMCARYLLARTADND